jgi:hypothetical protein
MNISSSSTAPSIETMVAHHESNKRLRSTETTEGSSLDSSFLNYSKHHFRDLELRIEDFILLVFERNMNYHKMTKGNKYVHTNFETPQGNYQMAQSIRVGISLLRYLLSTCENSESLSETLTQPLPVGGAADFVTRSHKGFIHQNYQKCRGFEEYG